MSGELKYSGTLTKEEFKDKDFKGGEVISLYMRGKYYDEKDENGETQFIKDLKKGNYEKTVCHTQTTRR